VRILFPLGKTVLTIVSAVFSLSFMLFNI
jgi:hypothetical protein